MEASEPLRERILKGRADGMERTERAEERSWVFCSQPIRRQKVDATKRSHHHFLAGSLSPDIWSVVNENFRNHTTHTVAIFLSVSISRLILRTSSPQVNRSILTLSPNRQNGLYNQLVFWESISPQ